ncbi:MAG: tetratricopeptide repeat protein [Bacteroidota bacterium]
MNLLRISSILGLLILLSLPPAKAQESVIDLYYSGSYDQVITHTRESIVSGDTTFNTFYLKALSEVQLGRTEDAIQTLKIATSIFPDDAMVKRMLAGQYYEAGDYSKSWPLYSTMIERDSTDVSSWLKLAEIASFRQKYNEAVEALEQVLLIDPSNLSSLMMLGDILNRLNNSGAVVYYERAYSIYPDNQKVAYALGNWYTHAQRAWETIPICEHILETDSSSIKFCKLMGYAYYKIGDPDPAIQHFDDAISYGDSTAFTFKFKGISHYLSFDFPGAIESLQFALKKDSMDAEVHFFLGTSMANTKEKKEAMHHLDRSLELMNPDPAIVSRIYSEQGNIMRLEMEHEKAYELYRLAWEADTTNPMALYYMASILDNSVHRSEEALVDYQRFLDQLNMKPEVVKRNQQIPSIKTIVEERIVTLKEELFFLDQ